MTIARLVPRSVRSGLAVLAALAFALPASTLAQQSGVPERAIRRDVPMTDAIQRAHAAGTRDMTGRPGPAYWQLQVDYDIEARLEPDAPGGGQVRANETVTLHNTSPDELDRIVLRLEQNVFRPDAVRARALNDLTEGMGIAAIAVNGEPVDLTWQPPRRSRYAADQPPVDRTFVTGLETTVATLWLPNPVPAGETTTLDIEWAFRVPVAEGGRGLRMGAWGDSLFQLAQWYPYVAKYDDLRGWNTDPYLGSSEFYHNYGSFDVTLDVPAGWTVGATGVLQNPEEVLTAEVRARIDRIAESTADQTIVGEDEFGPGSATVDGDRLVWHFAAETVNDFAWAASDRYVWMATAVDVPGGETIPFHWMYLPGDAARFEGAGPIGRHAIQFYSGLWMPYAYPQLTMVDGPDTGMEYPMFIMSATGAEDHEIGHEWWPMMVGTNETWYGFMDEGFNQYMNRLSRADFQGQPADLNGMGQSYGRISGDENEAPLMWNANYGGPMYSFQAYSKAPLMLSMLGGIVGDAEVQRAMSEYARTWFHKHPSPWDYAFFMNEALGRDLGWFWYSWLFTTEAVDGSIDRVVADGATTRVTVRQDGAMPSPVVLEVELAADGAAIQPMANATMIGERTAVVTWPVDVWFSGSRTFTAELDFGGRAVTKVTLDPDGRFPDGDPSDNVWERVTAEGAAGR